MQELNSAYFETLATKCLLISHTSTSKAYFEIEDADELNDFDQALRSMVSDNCMLLVSEGGELDDNNSANYVDIVEYQVYILRRKRSSETLTTLRYQTKKIFVEVIKRINRDFRANSKHRFRISSTNYFKVGPMGDDSQWYGYTAVIRFICPFPLVLKGGIWDDLTD